MLRWSLWGPRNRLANWPLCTARHGQLHARPRQKHACGPWTVYPSRWHQTRSEVSLQRPNQAQSYNLWSQITIPRQVILQATTTARRSQHKSFLEKVPILEQLTEYEILTIADALGEDTYEDGAVVCMQGDVGDAFYIIKKVISHKVRTIRKTKVSQIFPIALESPIALPLILISDENAWNRFEFNGNYF